SSALLEALDPEQNKEFADHYLEVPFDLSDVMFITTANLLDTIPPALRDRMEVIHVSSYTQEEKLHIALGFLVPKQLQAHAIPEGKLIFDNSGLMGIIQGYTKEAGVRNLEREIGSVCRKVARMIVEGKADEATGVAVTEVGGEIIPVEVTIMDGRGDLVLTGQLGTVMQESARAALS